MANKNFLALLERTKKQIEDITLMISHRNKHTYFTRTTQKMGFNDAIFFILKGIKKTMQIEIDNWFENLGNDVKMTKQAFSQLRQKISPIAFIELNDNFVRWYYDDDDFKKYIGYRLLSIDGSITEIPNTADNREHFGYYHNQSDRQQARAMVNVIYDIENDYILESDIRTWKAAERDVAKNIITKLSVKGFRNDLFLFDRGYPSKEMFDFLEEKGLKFLMRVKNKRFQTDIDAANQPDQIIMLST